MSPLRLPVALREPDWEAIAAGVGQEGYALTRPAELTALLNKALQLTVDPQAQAAGG